MLVLSAAIFDLKQAYNLSLILAQNCFELILIAVNGSMKDSTPYSLKQDFSFFEILEPTGKINLKKEFATLGRAFNDDGLNFFTDDFYYPYRNNLITKFANHLLLFTGKEMLSLRYLVSSQ